MGFEQEPGVIWQTQETGHSFYKFTQEVDTTAYLNCIKTTRDTLLYCDFCPLTERLYSKTLRPWQFDP